MVSITEKIKAGHRDKKYADGTELLFLKSILGVTTEKDN